jgi:hypothetical protein
MKKHEENSKSKKERKNHMKKIDNPPTAVLTG